MQALHSCRQLLLQLLMLQRVRRPGGVLRVVIRDVTRGMVCKLRAALNGKLHLVPGACIVIDSLEEDTISTYAILLAEATRVCCLSCKYRRTAKQSKAGARSILEIKTFTW